MTVLFHPRDLVELPVESPSTEQEALLLQRDRAMRYVNKLVLCFTRYMS